MPIPVKKNFCTIYRRTELEKTAFETAKELDKTKKELEDLKREMSLIRDMVNGSKAESEEKVEEETVQEEVPQKTTRKRKSASTEE